MKHSKTRRKIIQTLLSAGGLSALPLYSPSLLSQSQYSGKFLIALQLDGGLDVTSFCDPKLNVPGELEINHWANNNDIQEAGNIQFAPFAINQQFFEKYYQDMLVINGVDSQTNSHTVGVVNNWSGRLSEGFPSLTALMAAVHAPELPLAYINMGGFGHTQSIINSTRIDNITQLDQIINPNVIYDENRIDPIDWERIQSLHTSNLQSMIAQPDLPGGDRNNRELFLDAISKAEGLQAFADVIPDSDSLQQPRPTWNVGSSFIHQQIQIALLAFYSGVSIAADVVEYEYDTHDKHDERHEPLLSNTLDAIDYLWSFAEELGLADRLVVVIGTDFGRTPFYNSTGGKDHWSIGSYMIMEKNTAYSNWAYGETDEGHNAFNISPSTLVRDDNNGVIIRPAHVHKALRKYLGLDTSPLAGRFPFNNIEEFDFFG